jgi:hypothetical protein
VFLGEAAGHTDAAAGQVAEDGLGVVLSIHHVDRLNVDASTGPGGQDVSVRNKHRETPGQGENDGHTSFSKKRSFQGEYFQHKLKINEALRFCVCVSFIPTSFENTHMVI